MEKNRKKLDIKKIIDKKRKNNKFLQFDYY